MRPLAAALTLLALAGCGLRTLADPRAGEERLETVVSDGQVLRIHHQPRDAAAAAQVARLLPEALRRAARWGRLEREVTITLHPSHAALEAAVSREGFDWLRAWARYQTIDLQSPRTWSWRGAKDAEVGKVLAHELTHCVMYQAAAGEWTWPHKGIPLWFQEGMASVTAGQGSRAATLDDLARYYASSVPGAGDGVPSGLARAVRGYASLDGDPVTDPEPLYPDRFEVVYGAAHHAFEFLLARHGEEGVRSVLARMREGRTFAEAFLEALGVSDAAFAAEFRRWVLSQRRR